MDTPGKTQTDSKLRIGAALFNGDHGRLADEMKRLEIAGLDFVHLDVYDGHFVPDLGFSPRTIAALRPVSKLPFEVHLGAVDPLRFVPALSQSGAEAIICHIESAALTYEAIFKIRASGVRAGLAFSLGTPLAGLKPVIAMLDSVLLLSRVTGEGGLGASFSPMVLPRVSEAQKMAESGNPSLDIQVAGGIRLEHVSGLLEAGATSLTFGSSLFRSPDMAEEVKSIREIKKHRG